MSSNSPQSTQKPDLDESTNVTRQHDRVVREVAASAREKRLAENGHEPISLWVIAACAVVLLIAGSVLGHSGTWFTYDNMFREGYVRGQAPGGEALGPQPKDALAAFSARGSKIYSAKCNGCHGSNGKGDGANYPSLAGSDWVTGETQLLAMVILNGLQGPISDGKAYGVMPGQAAGMTAEDLAGVMTYVRNNFGNEAGDVVTAEMAEAAFDVSASRESPGAPADAGELTGKHANALPGEPLEPDTMVDPSTLQPIQ